MPEKEMGSSKREFKAVAEKSSYSNQNTVGAKGGSEYGKQTTSKGNSQGGGGMHNSKKY